MTYESYTVSFKEKKKNSSAIWKEIQVRLRARGQVRFLKREAQEGKIFGLLS